MTQSEVISLLKDYAYITKRIEDINQEIKKYQEQINDTRDANMGISYDGVKSCPTHKINDIVYQSVERIIGLYIVQITDWEKKLKDLLIKQNEIENILDGLTQKEREIVNLKYVKRLSWWQVVKIMNYSERQCKRICYQGINKIKDL